MAAVRFANITEEETNVKNVVEVRFANIIGNDANVQIVVVLKYANLGKIHTVQDVEHWAIESLMVFAPTALLIYFRLTLDA